MFSALVFDGATNPVHPNTIGSIDPHCKVAEVVKGTVFAFSLFIPKTLNLL